MTETTAQPTVAARPRRVDTTSPAAQAAVRRRYRAEARFRTYGLLAIATAAIFLAVLLVDTVMKALPAFTTHSLQLDVADRGFAYAQDAPLDMRMDQSAGTTAAEILATYGEGDLRRIFERYGEEKLAGRYARAIIAARAWP